MVCLTQELDVRIKGTNTIFFLSPEKYHQTGKMMSHMANFFVTTYPKRTNLIGKDLWKGPTSSVS